MIAVVAVLELILILSAGGLAVDGARWMMLRTNLAFAMQAGAAAGARELGKQNKTIKAAKDAVTAVVQANISATLADGLSTASLTSVKVLSSLNPETETSVDDDAKYLKVTGTAETIPIFLSPFSTMTATATAVD